MAELLNRFMTQIQNLTETLSKMSSTDLSKLQKVLIGDWMNPTISPEFYQCVNNERISLQILFKLYYVHDVFDLQLQGLIWVIWKMPYSGILGEKIINKFAIWNSKLGGKVKFLGILHDFDTIFFGKVFLQDPA